MNAPNDANDLSPTDGRRTPLAHRLDSLLGSTTTTSSTATQTPRSSSPPQAMHRRKFNSVSNAHILVPSASSGHPLRLPKPPSMMPPDATLDSDSSDTQSSSTLPVLRWLGNWSYGSKTKHTRSQSSSGSVSPSSSSLTSNSQPPSPQLAALSLLDEALHESLQGLLPTPPPRARIPESFHASRTLSRAPPFLDNLTRSTLPTSSLSHYHPVPLDVQQIEAPPIILSKSPPNRTSLDSLRRLSIRDRSRSIHTSAVAATATSIAPSRPASPTKSWWWQSENKDNVDTLLNEDDRAGTIQEERDNLRKKYRSPTHPVVFCHGLLGFDSVTIGPSIAPVQVTHWRGIKEVLEANGTEVLITRVPATSSPVDRAIVLEQKISEAYPGRSVHLIGHSMGGIDCRYLTTHLTYRKFKVLSITTIATPHRGSSFASHFLSTVGRSRMPSVLSLLDLLPNGGGDGKAFESLTVESMKKFNEETPDVPGVKYFSWGAVYEPGLIDTWKWPHSVILEKEGPNDGLVSVESSKWGTYLGTVQHVSHLDLVGWINPARYKWAEMMGKEIKFRPATFYLGIADMLAGCVDGVKKEGEEDDCGPGSQSKVGMGVELEEGGGKGSGIRSDPVNEGSAATSSSGGDQRQQTAETLATSSPSAFVEGSSSSSADLNTRTKPSIE